MDPIPGVPVFGWCPQADAVGSIRLRTISAQFGDGYAQFAADGIHNKVATWPVQFLGQADRIKPIATFLDARAGAKAFHWRPPQGELGLYRCIEYSLRPMHNDVMMLAATFAETFRA